MLHATFFQSNLHEEFGYSRVSAFQLGENSRNTFHILGKLYSTNNDIFLFNVARGEYLSTEQYKLLESIKDGSAMDGNRVLNFKKPNVFIVFANREPDRDKLSEDRLIILKISEDLTGLKEITDDGCKVNKHKGVHAPRLSHSWGNKGVLLMGNKGVLLMGNKRVLLLGSKGFLFKRL